MVNILKVESKYYSYKFATSWQAKMRNRLFGIKRLLNHWLWHLMQILPYRFWVFRYTSCGGFNL